MVYLQGQLESHVSPVLNMLTIHCCHYPRSLGGQLSLGTRNLFSMWQIKPTSAHMLMKWNDETLQNVLQSLRPPSLTCRLYTAAITLASFAATQPAEIYREMTPHKLKRSSWCPDAIDFKGLETSNYCLHTAHDPAVNKRISFSITLCKKPNPLSTR